MRRRATLLLCFALAACGTTQASLPYTPASAPAAPAMARPVVLVTQVTDRRADGREDPNWIGTIRGGFGNPIKRLEAPVPLAEVVRKAFADALLARGLLAPDASTARYHLAVEILALNADQLARREATAEFRVTLRPASGGAPVLMDQERANRVGGSVITLSAGVFGSIDELRQIAQQAMSEAIDRLLDKPSFAAALR
ncbi:hypothetical protein E0493_12875 [Roseomonas sp. M0104]|uniref:Lipoprotein n=1 Tax=Teichococcus coralli TaxID=2545983 RepID=A0A845BC40_9PROT|nr:hypothetical protein [Pseudoroseomonas coralli]MXP64238.1 hypothetical protein [Pseudoroseomonas coralli]